MRRTLVRYVFYFFLNPSLLFRQAAFSELILWFYSLLGSVFLWVDCGTRYWMRMKSRSFQKRKTAHQKSYVALFYAYLQHTFQELANILDMLSSMSINYYKYTTVSWIRKPNFFWIHFPFLTIFFITKIRMFILENMDPWNSRDKK